VRRAQGTFMRWMAVLPALTIVACADKGVEAEKRYEMVKRSGTKGELCAAGRQVADTYLQSGAEEKYRFWHAQADIVCQESRLTGESLPAHENENSRAAREAAEAAADAARTAALGSENESAPEN